MPLEALRLDVSPVGLHYTFSHYDIPIVDARRWWLTVGGLVSRPLVLTMENLRERPSKTQAVTIECAGNGRALLSPPVAGQPWLLEGLGTAEWTGTPLAPILREAGIEAAATDVVFTGLDRGVEGGSEQQFERSLGVAEALADGVMLAYGMNGRPLPLQHGFPLRLLVPGWYGMAHVKWLSSVTLVDGPYHGYQQSVAYRLRQTESEPGEPVERMLPRSLMVAPGIPEHHSRHRLVQPGHVLLEGRAWSGIAAISGVEVSLDGGGAWHEAFLGPVTGGYTWRSWRYVWEAPPGHYELVSRATDAAGNVQPLRPRWNLHGYANNSVQRVTVTVAARPYPVQPRPGDTR